VARVGGWRLVVSLLAVMGAMCIPLSARADAPAVSFGNFTDPSVSVPYGITQGPDGALWFTNSRNRMSIGRITTGGAISSYTDASIDRRRKLQ
jgi:streptogramin lyase